MFARILSEEVSSKMETDSTKQEEEMQRKILFSKIKGLNDQLSALLQKKIRIDLEIKRTRKKLSKLKSQSSTFVKTRIQLENFDPLSFTSEDLQLFQEAVGEDAFQSYLKLDQEIDRAELLLQDSENLPLYDEIF